MKGIKLFSMLGLMLLASALLRAETDYKGRTELGIQAGGMMFENSNLHGEGIYGGRFGYYFTNHWAGEASVVAGESDVKLAKPANVNAHKSAKVLIPTIEALYHFGSSSIRPFLAAGVGDMHTNPDFNVHDIGYNPETIDNLIVTYGAGVKWLIKERIIARLDARGLLNLDYNTPPWGSKNVGTLTAGLSWLFGGCEPKAVVPPPTPKVVDSDGDGVPDDKDACPGTPPGAKVDARGCVVIADTDGDGVFDDKDACPGTPAGVKVDDKGCPVDTDGDGVTDDKDKCPGTPAGVKVDANGCPSEATKAVPQAQWVLEGVTFETNSNKLTSAASAELDKAVEILKANPTVKVEIQGHTDNVGEANYNLKLSDSRAKSVNDYLVSKGIAADRLSPKGFGETAPIADNKMKEGRAKNRRIEFKVLSR